jgi:hypothetical protein
MGEDDEKIGQRGSRIKSIARPSCVWVLARVSLGVAGLARKRVMVQSDLFEGDAPSEVADPT